MPNSSSTFTTLIVVAVILIAAPSCVDPDGDLVEGDDVEDDDVALDEESDITPVEEDENTEEATHDIGRSLSGGSATKLLHVYSFYGSSTTSAEYCNSGLKPVKTKIKYQTDNAFGTGLTFELRKGGTSYGKRTVWATPSPLVDEYTWPGSAQAGNFYVIIRKKSLGGDDIVSGYFDIYN